jgi:micrococcal nuclease
VAARRVAVPLLVALLAGALAGCSGSTTDASDPTAVGDTGTVGSGRAMLAPRGPVDAGWRVSRVVDGDTIWVTRAGVTLKVRLIGIDTPETVAPGQPVGCFGPEASAYATELLLDRGVTLELDPGQGREDRYGRTLAYVWLDGPAPGEYGAQFNLEAVRSGHARQYLYDEPYLWFTDYVAAEAAARAAGRGLWGACPAQP